MGKIAEKKADFRLSMNLIALVAVCGVVGIPLLILLKFGWMLMFFIMCYFIVGIFSDDLARNLRRSPLNIFKMIRKLFDLEERHHALIKFLKLKETLIPRHWRVEKAK